MLHCFCVYGYPNAGRDATARERNEDLLRKTLEVAAELGDVPIVMLGDFNVDPSASAVLRSAIESGCWHDAAAV